MRRRTVRTVVALCAAALLVGGTSPTRAATPPAELISVNTPETQSSDGTISGDGSIVAYAYQVFGDGFQSTTGYVRDRAAQTSTATAMSSNVQDDSKSPQIAVSRDGCQLAYLTLKNGNNQIVATNRCKQDTEHVLYSGGSLGSVAISAHGRYVAFVIASEPYLVERVDRDADQNGVLDDKPPAFAQTAADSAALGDETLTGLVAIGYGSSGQVWLWDPTKASGAPGSMTLVSAADGSSTTQGNQSADLPSMTPDGRYVSFTSYATNLVPGASGQSTGRGQTYVRDVAGAHTRMVTQAANGAAGDGSSDLSSISADGTQVAFSTTSKNLLAPGPGGTLDSPVRSLDLLVATSTTGFFDGMSFDRVSIKPNGQAITPIAFNAWPQISSSGRWVVFESSLNAELQTGGTSGPATDTARNVYVMQRPGSLSISPITFGTVAAGTTSAAQTATVTSTGLSSVLPATIAASGDFSVVGGTCAVGAWLPPGRSCTVQVTFKPTAAGSRTGALHVAETGFAAVAADGTLAGTGQVATNPPTSVTTATTQPGTTAPPVTTAPKPKLSITPASTDFGAAVIGATTGQRTFKVTNVGNAATAALTTGLTGGQSGDFAITSDGCAGTTLAPSASCTLGATFHPAGASGEGTTLRVASGSVSATASLKGRGTAPSLSISPNPADFGSGTVKTALPPIGFTVTNTGSAADTIANVGTGGQNAGDFVVSNDGCTGATLAPAGTCNLTITFTPPDAGQRVGFLGVYTALVSATADLTGTGVLAPTLRMVPQVVPIGEVTIAVGVGFPANGTVALHWNGSAQTYSGVADANGQLRIAIPLRLDDQPGQRTMVVVDQPGLFAGITAPALVVEGSMSPPVDANPALPGAFSFVVRH